MNLKTKSPLKFAPLRIPGQSLDEKLRDVGFDALAPYMAAAVIIIVAVVEWIRFFLKTDPSP